MKQLLNKAAGHIPGMLAVLFALVSVIVFCITDSSDRTFSWITFGLIFAGSILEIVNIVKGWEILPLLSAVSIGAGMSWHLYIGFPTLSDIMNGVNFVGGNANAVIIFGILFLISTILEIVVCFTDSKRL